MEQNNLERPGFYAIITADVRYSDKISSSEKLLFAEITALTNKAGVCWASNKYFSKLYGVNPKTISLWIKHLTDEKFVNSRISATAGNKRYLEINVGGVSRKMCIPIPKNRDTYPEKCKDINTKYNNNKNKQKKVKTNPDLFFGGCTSTNTTFSATTALLEKIIAIVNPKEKATEGRIRNLNGRLKNYTEEEIIKAAKALSQSQWHRDNGQMSIDNLIRESKFGRWYSQSQSNHISNEPIEIVMTNEEIDKKLAKEKLDREERDKKRDWGF